MDKQKHNEPRMRKKIIAGNWKMNLLHNEAQALANAVSLLGQSNEQEVVIFPSAIFLAQLQKEVGSKIKVGAQNAYFEDNGAYTGEISMQQLKSIGINTVLIGHSERRDLFHETHTDLRNKVDKAIELGMSIFFCCGEHLEERNAGHHFQRIEKQLNDSLFHLPSDRFTSVVIAYEPVWAIGTGVTASKEQAEEMHAFIRGLIASKFGNDIAASVPILYGGSCKPENARELFDQPNIDGGLIGGASLKAIDFEAIIKAAEFA
jgi:triosephosphate isomerase (TIM)